jgi:hypothetical protein
MQITMSAEMLGAIRYLAERGGMAPATLAGSLLYQRLADTMHSRDFKRWYENGYRPETYDAEMREARTARRIADTNEETE